MQVNEISRTEGILVVVTRVFTAEKRGAYRWNASFNNFDLIYFDP